MSTSGSFRGAAIGTVTRVFAALWRIRSQP
jgi:hypothetical protein